ncbi:MAG: hypothetical protein M3362_21745 [Acidobacteriota bacterium]|nr:hypothetical protein [Acidobacteriota bacterium]
MPLLFSPLSEGILEGPFKPLPKSAFIMLHSGKNVSEVEDSMDAIVCKCLAQLKHPIKKAARQSGTKDYLEKIIQIIRGCGFGVAIFFEIGLCSVLGKPVILVKSAKAKPPSDFVRTEWITFENGDLNKLARAIKESIKSIDGLAKYYEELGDLAMEAEDVDLELAFERYRQAILIANKKAVRRKIKNILAILGNQDGAAHLLRASRTRFRKSILEFVKLLPQ